TTGVPRSRSPSRVVPPSDDLCFAAENRQGAVRRIAERVDLLRVVTSAASSNGMRLVELAQDITGRAERIESAADIRPEWLGGVAAVGVSSAASTPDDLVQDGVAYFRSRNPGLRVVEEGVGEDIESRKPRRVEAPA